MRASKILAVHRILPTILRKRITNSADTPLQIQTISKLAGQKNLELSNLILRFSHPFVTRKLTDGPGSCGLQSGLVRRPEARPQSSAFLGMGFSSRHELAGE